MENGHAVLITFGVILLLGMALVASSQFPEYRQFLLPTVIGSTVVFEIIGPVVTRRAMNVMDG